MTVVGMDHFHLLERLPTWVNLRSRGFTSIFLVIAGTGDASGAGGIYFLVAYLKLACQAPDEFPWDEPRPVGIFYDRPPAVFHARRARDTPDSR